MTAAATPEEKARRLEAAKEVDRWRNASLDECAIYTGAKVAA